MSALTYNPLPPLHHSRDGQPITTLSFDPVQDTLWAGSNSGVVSACYGIRGLKGVAFPVGSKFAVKKVVAGDRFVRASGIDTKGLGTWSKGGVNKWYFR
jgi:PAB-dependent poly(A)-specific ribonuclease subunit 2